MLKSMYSQVQNCVRLSSNIDISFGVEEGEPLSSILFILFVNDMHFELANIDDSVRLLENIYLFMLMYADDTILFSKSETGLQTLLKKLAIHLVIYIFGNLKIYILCLLKTFKTDLGINLCKMKNFCR